VVGIQVKRLSATFSFDISMASADISDILPALWSADYGKDEPEQTAV
jgi:hypothetical protein